MRRALGTQAGGFARFMGNGDQGIRRFERRWAPRFRFHADLEIEWGSTVLRARTRDVSSNGMFIESAAFENPPDSAIRTNTRRASSWSMTGWSVVSLAEIIHAHEIRNQVCRLYSLS